MGSDRNEAGTELGKISKFEVGHSVRLTVSKLRTSGNGRR